MSEPKTLPTHRLCVLNKETDKKARIGAGWLNAETGSISIVLDECTVLEGKRSELIITLFEVTRLPT